MNLPQLPQDKANHFVYGAVIAAIVMTVFGPTVAVVVTLAVAALKELSDWWQNYHNAGSHGVEFDDALATIFGGATVLAPFAFR